MHAAVQLSPDGTHCFDVHDTVHDTLAQIDPADAGLTSSAGTEQASSPRPLCR